MIIILVCSFAKKSLTAKCFLLRFKLIEKLIELKKVKKQSAGQFMS